MYRRERKVICKRGVRFTLPEYYLDHSLCFLGITSEVKGVDPVGTAECHGKHEYNDEALHG